MLQIDDSVTIQIAEAFDEMLGGIERPLSRQVLWEAWPNAVGGTRMAPTRGGGMHGSWRSTGLLSEAARGRSPFKNMRGGGWNFWQVQKFLGEYAAYCNHLIWRNARHMGYDVSAPSTSDPQIFDAEDPHFLMERLKKQHWPPSVPMVCSKMPTEESRGEYCEQNFLFKDGMHICTETLAARVGAGLACLLGCVYNRKEFEDEGRVERKSMLDRSWRRRRQRSESANDSATSNFCR